MSSRTPTTIRVLEQRDGEKIVLEEAQHFGDTPATAVGSLQDRFGTSAHPDRWLEVSVDG